MFLLLARRGGEGHVDVRCVGDMMREGVVCAMLSVAWVLTRFSFIFVALAHTILLALL